MENEKDFEMDQEFDMNEFRNWVKQEINEMAIAKRGNLKDYGNFITDYKKGSVEDYLILVDNNIKIQKLPKYNFELYKFKDQVRRKHGQS